MRLDELKGFRNFPELLEIGRMMDNFQGSYEALKHLRLSIKKSQKVKFLGSGVNAVTFQPASRNYVIKIYILDQGYDRAVQIMKQNQSDPHMPQIIWGPRIINEKHHIKAVVLEELHPIQDEELKRTIRRLGRAGIEYNDFKRDIKTAKLSLDEYFKVEANMIDQTLIDKKIEPILQFLKYMWPTLHKFSSSKATSPWPRRFDLHEENFMQRDSGTIVVIDPLI